MNKKFPDFVPPTKVAFVGHAPMLHVRTCTLSAVLGPGSWTFEKDEIRLGSMVDNDVVVDDDTVSRYHCRIVQEDSGYVLVDLRSTNGTFINKVRIREGYLKPGCTIGLGQSQLRFNAREEEVAVVPSRADRLGGLIGGNPRMREIYTILERIAPTATTVVIEGETGTGKDMIARALHLLSRRHDAPFIVVDCGAVAGTLIESELFGHEKGAFTGAVTTRHGAFELASGGTVFLDEIGELSLDLQPKLLRVLEQRELRRVGGSKTLKVDLRVISATRKDLRSEVEKGKFREDLYFRLNVVPITAPALRDRREDIPRLIDHFLTTMTPAGETPPVLSDNTKAALYAHDWPGNVRELRNVIERALALKSDPSALVAPLGVEGFQRGPAPGTTSELIEFLPGMSFRDSKDRWNDLFERRYLTWLLKRADGNISRAARDADMDRKYLHKLLRKYGITSQPVDDDEN